MAYDIVPPLSKLNDTALAKALTDARQPLHEAGLAANKQPLYKAIMPGIKTDEVLKNTQAPVKGWINTCSYHISEFLFKFILHLQLYSKLKNIVAFQILK